MRQGHYCRLVLPVCFGQGLGVNAFKCLDDVLLVCPVLLVGELCLDSCLFLLELGLYLVDLTLDGLH